METKAQAWLKSNQIKNEDRKTPSPLKIDVVKSDIQTEGQHEAVLSKGRWSFPELYKIFFSLLTYCCYWSTIMYIKHDKFNKISEESSILKIAITGVCQSLVDSEEMLNQLDSSDTIRRCI